MKGNYLEDRIQKHCIIQYSCKRYIYRDSGSLYSQEVFIYLGRFGKDQKVEIGNGSWVNAGNSSNGGSNVLVANKSCQRL